MADQVVTGVRIHRIPFSVKSALWLLECRGRERTPACLLMRTIQRSCTVVLCVYEHCREIFIPNELHGAARARTQAFGPARANVMCG